MISSAEAAVCIIATFAANIAYKLCFYKKFTEFA